MRNRSGAFYDWIEFGRSAAFEQTLAGCVRHSIEEISRGICNGMHAIMPTKECIESSRAPRTWIYPQIMPRTMSDLELTGLLESIGLQHDEAMHKLHLLVAPTLFGLALKVVRIPDLAEDVVQEAFLSIWRTAADYRPALSPPMAWMGMIVRSRAIESLRRRTAERAHLTDGFDDELVDMLVCKGPDPCDSVALRQQESALRYCMNLLETRQRSLITLAYLEERSHSEIAAHLDLPLGTVKTLIRRGMLRLRGTMASDDDCAPLSLRLRADRFTSGQASCT